jgi:hypothetical protein
MMKLMKFDRRESFLCGPVVRPVCSLWAEKFLASSACSFSLVIVFWIKVKNVELEMGGIDPPASYISVYKRSTI